MFSIRTFVSRYPPQLPKKEQTYVLPQLEEWTVELELVDDRQDKSCHNLNYLGSLPSTYSQIEI